MHRNLRPATPFWSIARKGLWQRGQTAIFSLDMISPDVLLPSQTPANTRIDHLYTSKLLILLVYFTNFGILAHYPEPMLT
jgi:hypothetical protein